MTPAVFSHGDLRLYLLRLLDEMPRHGYDLIQALTERTGGTYTPSAGTIYPRLSKLEAEGLVTKTTDGRKTVYEITDAGHAEVSAREGDLADIERGLADSVRLIAEEVRGSVREAMRSLKADLAAAREAPARPDAEAGGTSGSAFADDDRARTRAEVSRADVILAEFRSRVRADLRSHAARGGTVTPATVDALRARLDEASTALARALAER